MLTVEFLYHPFIAEGSHLPAGRPNYWTQDLTGKSTVQVSCWLQILLDTIITLSDCSICLWEEMELQGLAGAQ